MTWILPFIIALAATASHAAPADVADLQALIQSLQNSGIKKVGKLDLSKLSEQVKEITWNTTDQPLPKPDQEEPGWNLVPGPTTGTLVVRRSIPLHQERDRPYRRSAHYDSQTKTVTLSEQFLKENKDPEVATQGKLHEALGSLGYNDQRYSQSSALMLIASAKDSSTRLALAKGYGNQFFNDEMLLGGSGVSGGGDFTAIEIKNRVLKKIFEDGQPVSIEFLLSYPKIAIEPLTEPENQVVFFDYKIRLQKSGRHEEAITLFYPALAWANHPKNKELVVALIKYGITSFYPVSHKTKMVEIGLRSCPGEIMRMPYDEYETLNLILFTKASVLSKCENGYAETAKFSEVEAGTELAFLPGYKP